MTDPIADMLTRIRNGYMARLAQVVIPYSNLKLQLGKLLSAKGWVGEISSDKEQRNITVILKYETGQPVLEHIKRISRPGLRIYKRSQDLRKVRGGLGLLVISTSHGLMTGEEARKSKLGGEVIAEVW